MKKTTRKMVFTKQVISALNMQQITGGLRATQSDQALTGCHTNCQTDNCSTAKK
ncbi:hypothetical protein [Kordia zhangzhouensis]|uniref:hypothetical protein n=1 Tax=Kordia zhangzhouensis TaxID=1620405 RepID=UPI0012E064CA|nr:hypothetical protein [Kordia zhangzhouensis]